jgi:hypothetical protein
MNKIARFKGPILLLLLAAILIAVPSVLMFAFLYSLFSETGTTFVVPGEATVNIVKPGDYTLWHKSKTLVDGCFMSFTDDLPSGTTVTVFKRPEGQKVPLQRASSASVESGGTRRVAIGKVTLDVPGEYQIVVTGLDEKRVFYLDRGYDLFPTAGWWIAGFLMLPLCFMLVLLFCAAAFGWGIYILVRMSTQKETP